MRTGWESAGGEGPRENRLKTGLLTWKDTGRNRQMKPCVSRELTGFLFSLLQ